MTIIEAIAKARKLQREASLSALALRKFDLHCRSTHNLMLNIIEASLVSGEYVWEKNRAIKDFAEAMEDARTQERIERTERKKK